MLIADILVMYLYLNVLPIQISTDQFQQISRLQQQLVDSERKTMSYIKRHNRVQVMVRH